MLRKLWLRTGPEALQSSQDAILDKFTNTPLNGGNEVLNYVRSEVLSTNRASKNVVLAHGYGSGLGFWFLNFDSLTRTNGVRQLFAIDWLGMGGSDRPNCRAAPIMPLIPTCNSSFTSTEAVNFFIDSLDDWRKEMKLEEPFVLVGHSLGGYLACRYALKYPQHVDSLVLVSPVGFAVPEDKEEIERSTIERSNALSLVDALWSANFTPQSILRFMGPWSLNTVTNVIRRRFQNRWNDEDTAIIANYLFHISVAPASGEYALNSILKPVFRGSRPGVYAKEPLLHDFPNLQVDRVRVLYGDNDWLRSNAPAAQRGVAELKRRNPSVDAEVHIVPNAGHHIYLDNPDMLHEVVSQML